MEETAAEFEVRSLPFWVEITEEEAPAEPVPAGSPAPVAPDQANAPGSSPVFPQPRQQDGEPQRTDTMSIFGRRAGNNTNSGAGSTGGNSGGNGSTGSSGATTRRPGAQLRSVPLGPLRRNLAETVDALQQLFADVAARDATMELSEVELSFEVSASGGVQLIGTGKVEGTRGLTLTFKRA
jgi:hypothetical protein